MCNYAKTGASAKRNRHLSCHAERHQPPGSFFEDLMTIGLESLLDEETIVFI